MWFLLGLVTFVGTAVLMAWYRWDVAWQGEPRGAGRYKLGTYKGKVVSLRVGLAVDSALDFELKPEDWLDRLAKSVGISVEPQANRTAFDELVYVLADDELLVQAMRADARLLDQFETIGRIDAAGFRFRRLVCRRGQLWLDFKPETGHGDHLRVVDWALTGLQGLAQVLPHLRPGQPPRVDRRFLRAVILLGASSGLAITGLGHMLHMSMGYLPFVVDVGQLWSLAAIAAMAVVALLCALVLILLGRSSRAHLVLLEVLLVGGLGALLTCAGEIRDLDMEADSSPVQVFDTVVTGKHVTSHRRRHGGRSYTYYLELSDWSGRERTRNVKVSHAQYDAHAVGERLEVRQRAGYLGIRWVESLGDMR